MISMKRFAVFDEDFQFGFSRTSANHRTFCLRRCVDELMNLKDAVLHDVSNTACTAVLH